MSVKPIDLQTNIAKMPDVAKGEESRAATIAETQHLREKESGNKSKLVNTRLDENKRIEKTAIKREEDRKKRGKKKGRRAEIGDKKDKGDLLADNKLGILIDVRK